MLDILQTVMTVICTYYDQYMSTKGEPNVHRYCICISNYIYISESSVSYQHVLGTNNGYCSIQTACIIQARAKAIHPKIKPLTVAQKAKHLGHSK